MENAAGSTEDLIAQLDDQRHSPGDSLEYPLHELLGLDKEVRSIRVETAKKVQLEDCIEREKHYLFEIQDNLEYHDGIQEDIRNRIERLNDSLNLKSGKKALISLTAD